MNSKLYATVAGMVFGIFTSSASLAQSTPTTNPDISRLQQDRTIAVSGDYGRTPGGIVDLRTNEIVAPSSPMTQSPSQPSVETRTPVQQLPPCGPGTLQLPHCRQQLQNIQQQLTEARLQAEAIERQLAEKKAQEDLAEQPPQVEHQTGTVTQRTPQPQQLRPGVSATKPESQLPACGPGTLQLPHCREQLQSIQQQLSEAKRKAEAIQQQLAEKQQKEQLAEQQREKQEQPNGQQQAPVPPAVKQQTQVPPCGSGRWHLPHCQEHIQRMQQQLSEAKRKAEVIQKQLAEKQQKEQPQQSPGLAEQASQKQAPPQKLQQRDPVPSKTVQTDPDILRLQRDRTIATSGHYGRTPGGIVDLRTNKIVAPSSQISKQVPTVSQRQQRNQQQLQSIQQQLSEAKRKAKVIQEQLAQKQRQKQLAEQKRPKQKLSRGAPASQPQVQLPTCGAGTWQLSHCQALLRDMQGQLTKVRVEAKKIQRALAEKKRREELAKQQSEPRREYQPRLVEQQRQNQLQALPTVSASHQKARLPACGPSTWQLPHCQQQLQSMQGQLNKVPAEAAKIDQALVKEKQQRQFTEQRTQRRPVYQRLAEEQRQKQRKPRLTGPTPQRRGTSARNVPPGQILVVPGTDFGAKDPNWLKSEIEAVVTNAHSTDNVDRFKYEQPLFPGDQVIGKSYKRNVDDLAKKMLQDFAKCCKNGKGKFKVVAHSYGAAITYDALRRLQGDPKAAEIGFHVDKLVTLAPAPILMEERQYRASETAQSTPQAMSSTVRKPAVVDSWKNIHGGGGYLQGLGNNNVQVDIPPSLKYHRGEYQVSHTDVNQSTPMAIIKEKRPRLEFNPNVDHNKIVETQKGRETIQKALYP